MCHAVLSHHPAYQKRIDIQRFERFFKTGLLKAISVLFFYHYHLINNAIQRVGDKIPGKRLLKTTTKH